MQWFCQIEGHGSLEAVEDLFSPVQNELQRLQDHPELFPGVEVMQKFWRRLDDALASITQAQLLIHERGTRHAALVSEDDKLMNAEKMPRRDVSRKPWEQYLHNRAPGVNVDLSDMGSDGSVQILPMGALRLLHTMKEANESIIRGIEAVCLPSRICDASSTLIIEIVRAGASCTWTSYALPGRWCKLHLLFL